MKRILSILLSLLLFVNVAHSARTSSVDDTVPARNSRLVSSEIRSNFEVLKDSDERVYDVVAHYGADPTGAVDATTKIQATFDDSNGAPVIFPVGTYKVTSQLTLDAGSYTIIMPEGALIDATVADFFLKVTDNEWSNLEIRAEFSQDGIQFERSSSSSVYNKLTGKLKGPGEAGTKPAIGAGTKCIQFDTPAAASNYYNLVYDMQAEQCDILVNLQFNANSNTIFNLTGSRYWTGIQVSSSDNTILGGFGTNADTYVDASNISDWVRIGDNSNASSTNKIFTGAEPGSTWTRTLAISSGSTVRNNTIDVINDATQINLLTEDFVLNNNYRVAGNKNQTIARSVHANNGSYTRAGTTIARYANTDEGGNGSLNLITDNEVVTLTGAQTSAALNIPAGSRLDTVLFNVDEAVVTSAASNTWDADFTGGSLTAIAAAGQSGVLNTNVNVPLVPEPVAAQTNIEFDAPGAETFSSGKIEIVVFYWTTTNMGDAGADAFIN